MSSLSDINTALLGVVTALGRSITVRVRTIGTRNTSTLSNTVTTADHTVTAVRDPSNTGGLDGMGSATDVQSWVYRFRKSDLNSGSTIPAAKDLIVDGSATLKITSVETDADGLVWVVRAQVQK